MIVQGANNPLTIKFDASVADIPTLIVTMWAEKSWYDAQPIKIWTREDMTVSLDTAICPISEDETRALPPGYVVIAAKGLDGNGETVFWDEARIDVLMRRDKAIRLTRSEG